MLDDLALFQPEDLDDGPAPSIGRPQGMDVQDHEVAIGQHALDLRVGVRVLGPKEVHEGGQPLQPIGHQGVVLAVVAPHVGAGGGEVLLIDEEVVELHDSLLVRLDLARLARGALDPVALPLARLDHAKPLLYH